MIRFMYIVFFRDSTDMEKKVILGVIGSDAHVVGITILEQALSASGFDVINVGVQTSQEEFIEAAKAHDAEAVLVSSLYGHAKQDCEGFHEKIEEAGLEVVTYIGGNLAVGQDDFEETQAFFEDMGFDRVFNSETDPEDAIAALREDLEVAMAEDEREREKLEA